MRRWLILAVVAWLSAFLAFPFSQVEAKESAPLTVDYVGLQFISGMGVGGLGALLGLEVGSLSSTLLKSTVGDAAWLDSAMMDVGSLSGLMAGIVLGVHWIGTRYGVAGNLPGAALGAIVGTGLVIWSWSQPWLVVETEGASPRRFYRPKEWWRPLFRIEEEPIPPECAWVPRMIGCPPIPGFVNPLTAGVIGAIIGYNLGATSGSKPDAPKISWEIRLLQMRF